jgi:hypothetical protein
LKNLNPEQRSQMQTIVSRLKSEENLDKLKSAQEKLASHAAEVSGDEKSFFELYSRKIQERISELEKARK